MSLFKSVGNFIKGPAADFVKGVIPGKFDDVIIDAVLKKENIEDVKEGFFPSGKDKQQSFFNLREETPERGARTTTNLQRYTGAVQPRYNRFFTNPVLQRFSSSVVTPEKQKAVKVVKRTKSKKVA
tara:strand:+ start:101 stop:478 length:378 start_codon:yes stop_codon:yes gene_type:complete